MVYMVYMVSGEDVHESRVPFVRWLQRGCRAVKVQSVQSVQSGRGGGLGDESCAHEVLPRAYDAHINRAMLYVKL